MPELPEVETVKRIIKPQIIARTIRKVKINNSKVVGYPNVKDFVEGVVNKEIKDMQRRGKYLAIIFKDNSILRFHLRMTGQILITTPDFPEKKHMHIIFYLDNNTEMRYIDSRGFGRFWFLNQGEKDIYSGIDKLGIEPFTNKLSVEYLKSKFANRKKSIKACLLDQEGVAGIGNIYADEILFASKVCPSRSASSLDDNEWEEIVKNIPVVLIKGIKDNKMSVEKYLNGGSSTYSDLSCMNVYSHAGEKCPRCNTILQRIVLSGRSSVYCPNCQK